MVENLDTAVISVVSEVFETMFFMVVDPPGDTEGIHPPGGIRSNHSGELVEASLPNFLVSEIGFRGKASGKITLFLPRALAQKMASNFMGLEETEVSESQILDVAGELTNMISGNLLSRVDRKTNYQITLPRAGKISDREMRDGLQGSEGTLEFGVEGQTVILHIHWEP